MRNIDYSTWKEFRVGDLFDIHPTKSYNITNSMLLDGGKYPVIVNSAYYNGVGGFSSFEPTESGEMITFSDTVDANTIFYQREPFIGYAHIQGLYPVGIYANKWSEKSLLFFATLFRATALTKGFDYGNKFRREIASKMIVKIPVLKTGEPDWQFMEDYMRSVGKMVCAKLDQLSGIVTPPF